MALDQLTFFAARVFNGFAPRQHPKALGIFLDFQAAGSNGAEILIDLSTIEAEDKLSFVQAVYINNVLSGHEFTIKTQLTQQRLHLNAGMQAYLPFLAGSQSKFFCNVGGVTQGLINIQLLNFPVPAIVW